MARHALAGEAMLEFVIQYRVGEDKIAELKTAMRKFFDAQRALNDSGCSYRSLSRPDGVSFIHIARFDDEAAQARFQSTPHFKEWSQILPALCVEGPDASPVSEIEST